MPYANVNGTNLYYEEYGTGPAVMLTPGGRNDTNGLRPIAALLSPHCRVSTIAATAESPTSSSEASCRSSMLGAKRWPDC